MLNWRNKPVILVGHGCRAAGVDMAKLTALGVPMLFSWQAMDLLDSDHPLNFGRCGLYGQRTANKVLFNSDFVLAIGCRMSIWQCGYDDKNFAPNAHIVMVDIDDDELAKNPHVEPIKMDAKTFVDSLEIPEERAVWLKHCNHWRSMYPWVESPAHDDTNYINSHRFMQRLNKHLMPNQIIVTDQGTAMIAAHQVLRLKPPQRIMTSGGLGEMGCGLPAAIGASFASDKSDVLCIVGDGGIMMNLQELQTIMHHKLPIKIIVFSNGGYGMIKITQRNAQYGRVATDPSTGVSCPNFVNVARGFGIEAYKIESWLDFERHIPYMVIEKDKPMLLEVMIDPEQQQVPKLNPVRREDGTLGSPLFDCLSPIL